MVTRALAVAFMVALVVGVAALVVLSQSGRPA
jgi:hypothetical protein